MSTTLSKNSFLLHSFLDKLIGSSLGAYPVATLEEFQKYLPDEYQIHEDMIERSIMFARAIQKIMDQANNYKVMIKFSDGGYIEFGYVDSITNTDTNLAEVMQRYTTISRHGKKYIKGNIFEISDLISKAVGYSPLYDFGTSPTYIDNRMENKLKELIGVQIKGIICTTRDQPVFLEAGYLNYTGGHFIGIVITMYHIIICNSGEGTGHHDIAKHSANTSTFNEEVQGIVFLNRPDDTFLFDFLRDTVMNSHIAENTSIETCYASFFRLYYITFLKNHMDKVRVVVKNTFKQMAPMTNHSYKHSAYLNASLINQYMYSGAEYYKIIRIDPTKFKEGRESIGLFIEDYLGDIAEYITTYDDFIKKVLDDIVTYIPEDLTFNNISKSIIVAWVLNGTGSTLTLTMRIIYDILSKINQDIPVDLSYSNFPFRLDEKTRDIIMGCIHRVIRADFLTQSSDDPSQSSDDPSQSSDGPSQLSRIRDIYDIISKSSDDIHVCDFAIDDSTHKSVDSDYTYLSLFVDLLMHECKEVSRRSIICDRSVININSIENKIFLRNIATHFPIFNKFFESNKNKRNNKQILRSVVPNNFFIIPQYAGSCTYNGILLIMSLFGTNALYRGGLGGRMTTVEQFYNDYYGLHISIHAQMIATITSRQNVGSQNVGSQNKVYSVDDYQVIKQIINMGEVEIRQLDAIIHAYVDAKNTTRVIKLRENMHNQLTALKTLMRFGEYPVSSHNMFTYTETFECSDSECFDSESDATTRTDTMIEMIARAISRKSVRTPVDKLNKYLDGIKQISLTIYKQSGNILVGMQYDKQKYVKYFFNNVIGIVRTITIDNTTDKTTILSKIDAVLTTILAKLPTVKNNNFGIRCNDMFKELILLLLYVALKIISVVLNIDENDVQHINNFEKKFYMERYNDGVLENQYLTVVLEDGILDELIQIITRYQCLLPPDYRERFVLYPYIGELFMKTYTGPNPPTTGHDAYNRFYQSAEGAILMKFMEPGILYSGRTKTKKVNIYKMNDRYPLLKGNESLSEKKIFRNEIKFYRYEVHTNRVLIVFTKNTADVTDMVSVPKGRFSEESCVYYLHNRMIVLKIEPDTDVSIICNFMCSQIDYKFFDDTSDEQYTDGIADNFQMEFSQNDELYRLDPKYPIIDFDEITNIITYDEKTDIGIDEKSHMTSYWTDSPYAYRLAKNMTPLQIDSTVLVSVHDKCLYYKNHNVSKLLEYYKKEYNILLEKYPKLSKALFEFPVNIQTIIKKINTLLGYDMSIDKDIKNNQSKRLVINTGYNQNTSFILDSLNKCKLTYSAVLSLETNPHTFAKELRLVNHKLSDPSDVNAQHRKMENVCKDDYVYIRGLKKLLIDNIYLYSSNVPNFIVGFNDDYSEGIIAFTKKNNAYYEKHFYNDAWTDSDIKSDKTKHHLLFEASESSASLLWVKFSIDNFNIMIPKIDQEYVDRTRYYALTFALFCEYLLLSGKYAIFNILIPQLVSCYITEIYDEDDKLLDKHRNLIQTIINYNYAPCPNRAYIINRIKYLLTGSVVYQDVHQHIIRRDYYEHMYSKFNFNVDINRDREFDLKYYVEFNNSISDSSNQTVRNVLTTVNRIIDKILDEHNITDIYDYLEILNIGHIVGTTSNIIEYIFKEDAKNYEKFVINLQLNILSSIQQKLLADGITDEDVQGIIKYFMKPPIDRSLQHETIKYINLFMLISGKIIDQSQYQIIINMIDDEKKVTPKVYELLMGSGKTTVIIPCIIFIYMVSHRYQNIINCIPNHLVMQSISIFENLQPFFDGMVIPVKINRNPPFDIDTMWGNRGDARTTYMNKLLELSTHKVIIIDDTSIKTHILNPISQAVKQPDQIPTTHSNYRIDQMVRDEISGLKKIYSVDTHNTSLRNLKLSTNTLLIMDEFDMLTNPSKSDLNFPDDVQNNVDAQNILSSIIYDITFEIFYNPPDSESHYIKYSDRADIARNRRIIKEVMNLVINEKKMTYLIDRVKENGDFVEQFNMVGGTVDSLYMYFIREIYKNYVECFRMLLNKDYGMDNNIFIAIPYTAQNTPARGSKFSNPIITIILTCIVYFSLPLRNDDVVEYTQYMKLLGYAYSIDDIVLSKNIRKDFVLASLQGEYQKCHELLLDIYKTPEYEKYRKLYLMEHVFPTYVKVSPDVYNCSFIDVIDPQYMPHKMAISGTVNIHLPVEFKCIATNGYLTNIAWDPIVAQNIDFALHGNNRPEQTPPDIINYNSILIEMSESKIGHHEQMLEDYIKTIIFDDLTILLNIRLIKFIADYNVLIDVGSFLRKYTNEQFAYAVSIYYIDRHVMYFNDNNVVRILKNGIHTDYPFKKIKQDRTLFIYFDQKHTTGNDIDLHPLAKGLLTINSMNTYGEVVQGLYRMREINHRQTCNYLIASYETPTLEQLIDNINRNESTISNKYKYKFYQQLLLCLVRAYAKYDRQSYKHTLFMPSTTISTEIFVKGRYEYAYEKKHFISNILAHIAKYDQMYSQQPHENTDHVPILWEIKTTIDNILKQYRELHDVESVVTTQREMQRATQRAIAVEVSIYRPPTPPIAANDMSRIYFTSLFNPFSTFELNKYYMLSLNLDGTFFIVLEQIFSAGTVLSMSACFELANHINIGRIYKKLYIIKNTNETKFILCTSLDKIVHSLYDEDTLQYIETGISIQKVDTKLAYINNLIFILLCKVPHISDLEFLQRTTGTYPIKRSIWPDIFANYKKFARYDMKSILPQYYEFMNTVQPEAVQPEAVQTGSGKRIEMLYIHNKQTYLSLI